ncbi:hypothetical protein Tco_0563839 [Tanacetum coccineum]
MASTRASISKVSKRPKINIIPPKQLFVDLTQDDTTTPSPKLPISSPSAPNAPSKTPSTKDTSSSSIDYIPKSPTSSTSLSPNGYLNPPTSPPPRVSPPPPTQENASMDITLTLSLITPLDKTEGPMQSSSVLSDFASQFLNLDNALPNDNEIISMMNVEVSHKEPSTHTPFLLTVPVTVIPETSTVAATTVPLTIPPFTPIPQQVSALEKDLSQFKQVDHSAQLLAIVRSQVPAMLTQAKNDRYIDFIKKSIKDIIKDEVKSQLPQILPNEVSDFATPVIQSTINESTENVSWLNLFTTSHLPYAYAASHTEY